MIDKTDPHYRLGWLESALQRLAQTNPDAAEALETYRRECLP